MKPTDINVDDHRKPDWPIESLLYRRWSPRAMSGEELSNDELMTLFEAARWAPSSYNAQHWRTKRQPRPYSLLRYRHRVAESSAASDGHGLGHPWHAGL